MKIWITIWLLTTMALQVQSQTMVIPEKKMYEAPDGKVYIQKNLPVYIRLGTTPDDPLNAVLLTSETTSKYTNPMYFDTEGRNTLRSPYAVDKVTKQVKLPKEDIIFEIYADSHPPVTAIHFGETKTFRKNGKYYLNGTMNLTFSSYDELSGVDKIMVSIDSSAYTEYTAPIKFELEKEYIVKYYSYDHVGNVEKVKRVTIVIDRTNPKTTLEIKGDQSNNVLSGRSILVLNTSPDTSGIARKVVKIDDNPEHSYFGPIGMSLLTQGEHKLIYYSIDNVGNHEVPHEFDFYVDKTPPTIMQDIIGKSFLVNGKEYSSGQSQLKITTIDNKAGVKAVYYSINGSKFKIYEKPIFLSSMKGNLLIKVYAEDNVNNRSEIYDNTNSTKIPFIDLSGPSMNYAFTGPVFNLGDTTFICSKTKIKLIAVDYESGLNNIQYRVDQGASLPYQEPFTIESEGIHSIEFTGTDNVDNTTTSSFKVLVDNTGPQIYPRFSTLPKRTTHEKDTALDVYPPHVVLFVAATDVAAGYDHMIYSINGLPAKLFSGSIGDLGTKNSIVIKAYDKLGNETTAKLDFEVGN